MVAVYAAGANNRNTNLPLGSILLAGLFNPDYSSKGLSKASGIC
jgi:hypothetical protein